MCAKRGRGLLEERKFELGWTGCKSNQNIHRITSKWTRKEKEEKKRKKKNLRLLGDIYSSMLCLDLIWTELDWVVTCEWGQ